MTGGVSGLLAAWGLPEDSGAALLDQVEAVSPSREEPGGNGTPVVISTWKHGRAANEKASEVLAGGGGCLDAVEQGVRVSEDEPGVTGVGLGGLPDETGTVTLDASIMGPDGNAGAVGALEKIRNPVSVARKVMEETDHVFLVGEGALAFARAHGFEEQNLLTDESRKAWLRWRQRMSDDDDWLSPDVDHDTIGMVALDARGDLAGACTTSGLSFKIHGRVGDSPVIGAGMYVANGVGGAAATGRGEAVLKICGSFLVVERMRAGKSPREACEEALGRIVDAAGGNPDFQVAFIALDRRGRHGAASIKEGFEYAITRNGTTELVAAKHLL